MREKIPSRLFRQLVQPVKPFSDRSIASHATNRPTRTFASCSYRAPLRSLYDQSDTHHSLYASTRKQNLRIRQGAAFSRAASTVSAAPANDDDDAAQATAGSRSQPRAQSNLRPQGDASKVRSPKPDERGEVPAYELTFTCKPCSTRSTHRISKHGYHNGTVLITCPQCKNRHVISDHLRIFNDAKRSFEDILKEKGELLKTGTLDPDGDIELWGDRTQLSKSRKDSEE